MKTFKLLFLMLIFAGMMAGCAKDDSIQDEDLLKSAPTVNHETPGLDQDRWITMTNYDLNIHYRIIGKGPIDVIWLPGWTNPLTVYTMQFDYFRDKARCIYIDFPGQGLSDAPNPGNPLDLENTGFQYTAELLAEAVHDVVKKEGLHHFVAVGFSMGPAIWAMFERQYPGMITKLVAIDGDIAPWSDDPFERAERQAVREATYWDELTWDETFKEMLISFLIPDELVGEDAELLKEWAKIFINYPSDILADMAYNIEAENVHELVGWTFPILAFYSDPDTDMDRVNMVYPNNTTYFFPGGGHVIHWVFHSEINPMIWEFVKDNPGKKY
jgi:pimeloyl-ACP methyl ester carboxylesterase